MKTKKTIVPLTDGALLQLSKSPQGYESAKILVRTLVRRMREWNVVTPPFEALEDGIAPEDYGLAVLAHKIKQASRYNFFRSNLSRFAWKISRLGFKDTAGRLSWLLKEELNGYPIYQDIPGEGFLFVTGSPDNPRLFSGKLDQHSLWKFTLAHGLTEGSQEKLIDELALATLHDFRLRELFNTKALRELSLELSSRRQRHKTRGRPLRAWRTENTYPKFYQINTGRPKESFAYSLVLKVKASNGAQGLGKSGVCNNALIEAADRLADSFKGAYRVEGLEAQFELASDLMSFMELTKSRDRVFFSTNPQVYLNVTDGFKLG